MRRALLAGVVLIASVAAQDTEISSCSALSCINSENQGVCASANSSRAVGVGMASEVLVISGEKLSFTFVDGSPDGVLVSQEGYQFSTQTLYVGVPPNHNSSNERAVCALMLQHQAQTFGLPEDSARNTTSCRAVMPDSCQNEMTSLVERFQYTGSAQSNQTGGTSLPRCKSLAQFLNTNINHELSFCGRYTGFINITGGPISGADLSPSPVRLQSEGCQPVIPESYELRRVAEMRQILPTGEVSSRSSGGRSGVTPIFMVLYDEEGGSPIVQLTCMRTFNSDGEEMPDALNTDESSAIRKEPRAVAGIIACLLSFAFLLA